MRLLDLLAFKYVIGYLGSFLSCSDLSDTMRDRASPSLSGRRDDVEGLRALSKQKARSSQIETGIRALYMQPTEVPVAG
jgi:hypothetical protein